VVVKGKKRSIISFALLAIVLIVILLILNNYKFNTIKADTLQYIMSNNLGFSSRERLVGEFAPKGNSIDL
jgi:uncharacterized membrane protein YkgB